MSEKLSWTFDHAAGWNANSEVRDGPVWLLYNIQVMGIGMFTVGGSDSELFMADPKLLSFPTLAEAKAHCEANEAALLAEDTKTLTASRAESGWVAKRSGRGRPAGWRVRVPGEELDIAVVYECDYGPETSKKHAHLIAAAPELLAACKAMLATMRNPKSDEGIMAVMAIAKAEGT